MRVKKIGAFAGTCCRPREATLLSTFIAVLFFAGFSAAWASAPIVPVHGIVLAVPSKNTAVIRNDAVTGMLPAMTRTYRVESQDQLAEGVGIDGFVDKGTRPWRWYDAVIAAPFVPGLPQKGKVIALDLGSALPRTTLVDQAGRLVDLSSFRKVTLVSFIFTRCKDECPIIASKFAAMQRDLDPRHFHLFLITIDPMYDSPAVLARYARQFGLQPATVSLLTGQQHEVSSILNRFGITSLKEGDANFIHSDRVFLSANGKVAQILETAGFTPGSLAAQARQLAGMASSPWGRFQLWLIAGVTALCGGNQFAGIVALETVLFLIIAGISFVALGWVARRLWGPT